MTEASNRDLSWWALRLSAIGLIPLLTIHLGLQFVPELGFTVVYTWGVAGLVYDLTLALVFLHGYLGVQASLGDTRLDERTRLILGCLIGVSAMVVLAYRWLG